MEQVQAVVLETNGKLSVIRRSDLPDASALQNVASPNKPRSKALPEQPQP